MAIVEIDEELAEEIIKKFKTESEKIFNLMRELKDNPKKGKELNTIGKLVLKEIKYKSFRFYFVTNGYEVKFLKVEQLQNLLIKFLRMSHKNNQQEVIEDIKKYLREIR